MKHRWVNMIPLLGVFWIIYACSPSRATVVITKGPPIVNAWTASPTPSETLDQTATPTVSTTQTTKTPTPTLQLTFTRTPTATTTPTLAAPDFFEVQNILRVTPLPPIVPVLDPIRITRLGMAPCDSTTLCSFPPNIPTPSPDDIVPFDSSDQVCFRWVEEGLSEILPELKIQVFRNGELGAETKVDVVGGNFCRAIQIIPDVPGDYETVINIFNRMLIRGWSWSIP